MQKQADTVPWSLPIEEVRVCPLQQYQIWYKGRLKGFFQFCNSQWFPEGFLLWLCESSCLTYAYSLCRSDQQCSISVGCSQTLFLKEWQLCRAMNTKKINGRIRMKVWVKLTCKLIAVCCRLHKPGFYHSKRLVVGALLCRCVLILQFGTTFI